MLRSESIATVAKALVAAQKEMPAPKRTKTAKAGTFSYSYADGLACKEAYQPILAKHGLCVIHSTAPVDGHVVLTTTLLHECGEFFGTEFPIPAYAKPQEQGSALTYFKRYNTNALLDLAAEDDDDGAAAQAAQPVKREPVPVPKAGLSAEDQQAVHAAAKKVGIKSTAALAPVLMNIVGVSNAAAIPQSELQNVLEALRSMPAVSA